MAVTAVLRPLAVENLDVLLDVQREGGEVALGHIFPQDAHPFPTAQVRARWEAALADPGVDRFAVVRDGVLPPASVSREVVTSSTSMWSGGADS